MGLSLEGLVLMPYLKTRSALSTSCSHATREKPQQFNTIGVSIILSREKLRKS